MGRLSAQQNLQVEVMDVPQWCRWSQDRIRLYRHPRLIFLPEYINSQLRRLQETGVFTTELTMNSTLHCNSCKYPSHRFATYLAAFLLCTLLPGSTLAQGTLRITFDGPPTNYPPGGSIDLSSYSEAGMLFEPNVPGPDGYVIRVWPELYDRHQPYNGTIFISFGRVDLRFGFEDAGLFQLISVDLAEAWSARPTEVQFIAYLSGGGVVSTNFITDGILQGRPGDFQTFYFGPEFTTLTHVIVPRGSANWALDNIVGQRVPEPAASSIFALAVALTLASSGRRQGSNWQATPITSGGRSMMRQPTCWHGGWTRKAARTRSKASLSVTRRSGSMICR